MDESNSRKRVAGGEGFSRVLGTKRYFSVVYFVRYVLFCQGGQYGTVGFYPRLRRIIRGVCKFSANDRVLINAGDFVMRRFAVQDQYGFSYLRRNYHVVLERVFQQVRYFYRPSRNRLQPRYIVYLFRVEGLRP